ncbi:MAG: hypothetical protein ACO3IN_13560 [Steroidobacteraceae bacterium]
MTLRRAAQNVVDVWRRFGTAESLRGWMEILEKELSTCDRCGKVTRDGDVHTCTPRRLTDEVIADLWARNGTYHHHFARAIERYLKGEQ